MINPSENDVGRRVIFRAVPDMPPDEGTITSVSDAYVFVRYDSDNHSKATRREHLEWAE